jgi:hypothetical protein
MGKSGKETWNWTIMEEKRELIEGIVDGYRKLWYSEEKIEKVRADLLSDLQKEPWLDVERDELYWDKDKILENLKQKVVVEENVNYMWYKWKKVHITLPEVEWKFEWFKFEYFVSDETVYKKYFESKPELVDKSYSMKDVWKLLKAMNRYMQAMGIDTDWDIDYENDLKYWKKGGKYRCNAWDCVKNIAWLDDWYWLKDYNVEWKRYSRAAWTCVGSRCQFLGFDYSDYNAKLFLRLS